MVDAKSDPKQAVEEIAQPSNIYIIVRESAIHNKGVFAKIKIPKDTRIIEYIGEKISKDEGTRRLDDSMKRHKTNPEENAATYIFELDLEYDLDGDIKENPAKYINHSCDPNCEIEIADDRIWVIALRDIAEGEELHYNYGFVINIEDPYDFKQHPCRCRTQRCVGYILAEDEWEKMKELLDKEH